MMVILELDNALWSPLCCQIFEDVETRRTGEPERRKKRRRRSKRRKMRKGGYWFIGGKEEWRRKNDFVFVSRSRLESNGEKRSKKHGRFARADHTGVLVLGKLRILKLYQSLRYLYNNVSETPLESGRWTDWSADSVNT